MQVFDAVAPADGDDSDDSTAWTELLLIGNSERKSQHAVSCRSNWHD